jgi:nitroreductase
MDVKEAINKRRAYRALEQVAITPELIQDLSECAQLSASCFNNQPWRFVFVYENEILNKMHEALSSGNEWAKQASMIIAVLSKKEYDCIIRDRKYYQFDTGMATAQIILRATELNLVAHPIAGYSPKKVREILDIPQDMDVIALIIVGEHSKTISSILSEKQVEAEKKRPDRIPLSKFTFSNRYDSKKS